jgi:hypothetical protein
MYKKIFGNLTNKLFNFITKYFKPELKLIKA